MIPDFDTCIACDAIRPELYGKLILLGFLGVCPNVDVGLQNLDQPSVITFLLSGSPGDGEFVGSFDIVDETETQTVSAVAAVPFTASPGTRTNLAATFVAVFNRPGIFVLRCVIDDCIRFRARFRVSQGEIVSA